MPGENEHAHSHPKDVNSEINKKVFDRVEKLLQGAGITNTSDQPYKIEIHSNDGRMDAQQVKELLNSQEEYDLSEAEVGDVIWWRDEKGRSGYYRITNQYPKVDHSKYNPNSNDGRGEIRLERSKRIVEDNEALIEGATFSGSMLKAGKILLNVPLEIHTQYDTVRSIPLTPPVDPNNMSDPRNKAALESLKSRMDNTRRNTFYTAPIKQMGVIRRTQLSEDTSQ